MMSTTVKLILIIALVFTTAIITYVIMNITKSPKKGELFINRRSIPKGILSFSGGGLRALTADTGVVHGIRTRFNGELTLGQILDKFRILSGNSGGTWFNSLMVYSPAFFNMLNDGVLYNDSTECQGKPVPGSEEWSSTCGTLGMNTCGTNNKQCCCNFGRKYNSSNLTTKCSSCNSLRPLPYGNKGVFSYEQYIGRLMNRIEELKAPDDSFLNATIEYLFPKTSSNYFKPFYYYYNSSWSDIVKEIIFDPAGDMETTTISSNPNKLSNHCVWAGVLLQNATLSQDVKYTIGAASLNRTSCRSNTPINDCGRVYPITFDYDHKVKASTLNVATGVDTGWGDSVDINYRTKGGILYLNKDIQEFLSNKPSPQTLVRSFSTVSSAAPAIIADSSMLTKLDEYVNSTPVYSKMWNLNVSGLAASAASGAVGFVMTPTQLATKLAVGFGELSIPIKLNNKKGEIEITDTKLLSMDPRQIMDDTFARGGDGAYFDNTSISNAIRAWQNDNWEEGLVCKIIHVNTIETSNTFQNNTLGDKTNGDIYKLFGCIDITCDGPNSAFAYLEENILGQSLPVIKPHIFDNRDFANERCLWWGRCSGDNNKKCSYDGADSNCLVEVSITFYSTFTIDHKATGVQQGTPVELYVINVNSTNSSIMILPGKNAEKDGLGYVATATNISNLMQQIPKELFDIMFSDKGSISEYRGRCGDVPVCTTSQRMGWPDPTPF